MKAYRQASVVQVAAVEPRANPSTGDIFDARVLEESARERTAATRRRIAEAASIVSADPAARRELSPLLAALVEQQAGRQAARLVAGAEEAVADVMLKAVTDGWSVPRTADALRERFSEFSRTQATMLARTDLISLTNGASVATATSLGGQAPALKTWLATRDNRTRPDHVSASGQTVPLDQPFNVAGVPLMYPGDPDGPDSQCINCRCTLIYADEAPTQLLHSEQGGIIAAAEQEEEPVPWKILERDGEFCVTKTDTGETVKCHTTKDQALAHQRALYANQPEMAAAAVSAKVKEYEKDHADSLPHLGSQIRHDPRALLPPEHDGMREAVDLGLYTARRGGTVVSTEFQITDGLIELQNPESIAATLTVEQRRRWAEEGVALPDGSYAIPDREFLQKAILALGGSAQNDEYKLRVKRHIIKRALQLDAERARELEAVSMLPEDWGVEPIVGENLGSLAAAIPVEPPSEWFDYPEPDEAGPITITAEGHIYAWAALWGTCHTGFPGRCRTAPPSPSGYRYYHLGTVDTADGKTIPVGNITLRTGHASLTASRQEAAAHYDNTGLVAADVVARDGVHGIWVTGALRPSVGEEAIRELKGAKLSGDWRGVNGALEMIGLLAVNVPGFPVPRPQAALAASADGDDYVTALVAAGVYGEQEDLEILTDELFRSRLRALSARAGGLDELVALGLGETGREARLRRTSAVRKVPVVTVESAPAQPRVEVTVPVGGEQIDVMAYGDQMDREIGYRVGFFADHGYWPATPQSGAALTPEEWQVAQDAAAELVADPDTEEMSALRQRLLDRGFIAA